MQPIKEIYVTPKEKTGGFTVGKVYAVLAIGMDINYQPQFTVADDGLNIKNVGADRFQYVPEGQMTEYKTPWKWQQEHQREPKPKEVKTEEVDYEVVDDGEDEQPFETGIEDPEEPAESADVIEEMKDEKPAGPKKPGPKAAKSKKPATSGPKKSPARPKKK